MFVQSSDSGPRPWPVLRAPSWRGWFADVCLFPWIGPALAYFWSSGDIDPVGVLLGVVLWPVVFVVLEMRRIRRRKREVEAANPFPVPPPDLLTYFILSNASLVLFFIAMILMAIAAETAAAREAQPLQSVPICSILAVAYVLFLSVSAIGFHRLRRAVNLVNECLRVTGE